MARQQSANRVRRSENLRCGRIGKEVLNGYPGKPVWNWNAGDSLVRMSISRRWMDGLLIFIVAIVSLFGAARLGLTPRDPDAGVGVVFAPWVSESSALSRATEAGARFVRFGGLPFIVVVVPEASNYLARISADGAILVVDPQVLAACLSLVSGAARS